MRNINEQKSMELGELYRELRIARGLKLKDVAKTNLSISQLSKFENGQTMLSADRLLLAIEGIHMTFSEFGHVLNDYKAEYFFDLDEEMVKLFSSHDLAGMKELLNKYRDYESYDIYNHLNMMVIKEGICTLDPSYEVSEEDIQRLTSYLYEIEYWTAYELYIFGNTVALLSDQDLIFLGKALVERNAYYRSIASYEIAYKATLINLIFIIADRELFYYMNYFISALEEVIDYRDLFFTASLKFLKLIERHKKSDGKYLSEINRFLESVALVGSDDLVELFKMQLPKLMD